MVGRPAPVSVLAVAVCLAGFAPSRAETGEGSVAKELEVGQSRLRFYGFFRVDLIRDDSKPDNAQTPLFIPSEDPSVRPEGQENLTLHPRLTRLGLDVKGPSVASLAGGSLQGKLELDFQNGGRESRQIVRIRHAWAAIRWERLSLLGGQTWDLISPLFPTVNNDTLMWNAGNLGDRRPQIRLTFEAPSGGEGGKLSVGGALGLTGAIDEKDLDADKTRDGEASGRPNVQFRAGWSRPFTADRGRVGIGVSLSRAWEKTATPVAGERNFRSESAGLDFELRLRQRVTIQAEAWTGRNLSDFRGGIGQGVSPSTGSEIRSRGGWFEAGTRTGKIHSIYAGVSLDDPDDDEVGPGGRIRNRAWWIVNRFETPGPFLVGFDLLRWKTDFAGLAPGTDNRINAYVQFGY